MSFAMETLDKKPSKLATLADYQIAHGRYKRAKALHVLHWPSNPVPPSTQPTLSSGRAKFRFESYTLRVVTDMLAMAKDEHDFHDYFPKHTKINDLDDFRRTNRQLYGDLPLEEFVELMYDLICEVEADLVVIHSGPARRALKKRLRLQKDRPGAGQNYEIMDVVICGNMVGLLKYLHYYKPTDTFLVSPNLPPAW